VIFSRRVSVRIYGLAAVALGLLGLVWGDFECDQLRLDWIRLGHRRCDGNA